MFANQRIGSVNLGILYRKEKREGGILEFDLGCKLQKNIDVEVRCDFDCFSESFDVEEESTGAKSLLVIGGIILDSLESGRVLVVDEFGKNLHPSISS